jgi:hypothetical protein
MSKKKILVLYWYSIPLQKMRLAIQQHLTTMESSDREYSITYRNVFNNTRPERGKFDIIILHNTFLCMRWSHLFYRIKWNLNWIKDYDCIKIAIPQDEYDHSEVLDEWLYELGVHCIFSCFEKPQRDILYPIMSRQVPFYECLTGYIDQRDSGWMTSPLQIRKNDIVYRASKLPYWFGSHGQLKHEIANIIEKHARPRRLCIDISTRETDTIVGSKWLDFMGSGRTVIGCESGSSVLDRRGERKAKIQVLLRDDPSLTFDDVSKNMPAGWDDFSFFAISPRHLEAVVTKTCQILVEGNYSGVLKPDIHYISIRRDFSNLDEVLEKIKDTNLLQKITNQAYEDIFLSGKYSYKSFATEIDHAIELL